jgi:hypothetical protein
MTPRKGVHGAESGQTSHKRHKNGKAYSWSAAAERSGAGSFPPGDGAWRKAVSPVAGLPPAPSATALHTRAVGDASEAIP